MQAAECITKGQEKYNAGDRMGALRFFEQSLKKVCAATPECFMCPSAVCVSWTKCRS